MPEWSGLGVVPAYFRPVDPSARCRAMIWVIEPLNWGARLLCFSRSFLLHPAEPLHPRGRGRSGIFCHSECGTGLCCCFFPFRRYNFSSPPSLRLWRYFGFSFFRRHVFAPPPPFQVIWRWFSLTFFLSRTDGPPFFPFVLGVPYRLRGLAVQSCGGGVLRSRIYLRLI